jgi:hypothetical protein
VGSGAELDVVVKRKITSPAGNQTHSVTLLHEICSSNGGGEDVDVVMPCGLQGCAEDKYYAQWFI